MHNIFFFLKKAHNEKDLLEKEIQVHNKKDTNSVLIILLILLEKLMIILILF